MHFPLMQCSSNRPQKIWNKEKEIFKTQTICNEKFAFASLLYYDNCVKKCPKLEKMK